MDPLQVVLQFLKEEGYHETFDTLCKEAEVQYNGSSLRPHILRQNIGEMNISDQTVALRKILSGQKLLKAEKEKKETYSGSPVALISVGKEIIASFTDQSIKKYDTELNEIACNNLKMATVLCFKEYNGYIYFSTMSGVVGFVQPHDLSLVSSVNLPQGSIVAMVISDGLLFAASRSQYVAVLKADDLSNVATFQYGSPITAMCKLNDGVIYAVQNDPVFHFRPFSDVNQEHFFHMSPNAFEVGALDVRDMLQCPIDESIFVSLTDRCKAYIYRLAPNGGKSLEVLKVLTHFISDGLTQPQLLWTFPPTILSTSDDQTIVAIDIETDSLAFQLKDWNKATRCITTVDDKLYVGAFDKSITSYKLTMS